MQAAVLRRRVMVSNASIYRIESILDFRSAIRLMRDRPLEEFLRDCAKPDFLKGK
jgi:hypothetical protein